MCLIAAFRTSPASTKFLSLGEKFKGKMENLWERCRGNKTDFLRYSYWELRIVIQ